jgi:hypothetical protein
MTVSTISGARGLEDRLAHGHAHGRYRRACPSPACGRHVGRSRAARTRRRSRAQPAIASHAGRVGRVFVGPAATRPVRGPSTTARRADDRRRIARERAEREKSVASLMTRDKERLAEEVIELKRVNDEW